MRKLLYLLLVGAAIWMVLKTLRAGAAGVSRDAIRARIAQGARVVDVRTAIEFGSGHYPGALNIPLDQLENRLNELPGRDRPIVVYCHSGARAAHAAAMLRRCGYTDVMNAGGLGNLPR